MTTQTSGINTYSSIEGKLGEVLFFLASTGPIEKALIDFAIDSLKLYPGTELNTNNIAYTLSEVNLADNFGPIEYTHPIDLMCRLTEHNDQFTYFLRMYKPELTAYYRDETADHSSVGLARYIVELVAKDLAKAIEDQMKTA